MLSPRSRPLVYGAILLLLVWAVAIGGFRWARNSRVTAERVKAYVESIDLSRLTGEARARAIARLAEQLNALPLEERRRARLEGVWLKWFQEMTEAEKGSFVEATMPTGVRQMLTAFEQMDEPKRRKTVEDAVKRLREAQEAMAQGGGPGDAPGGGASGPPVSAELQERMTKVGLSTYYGDSSAQTKAELAPLLEELQRSLQQGGRTRRGH